MAGNNSTVGLETVTFTDNMSFDGTERGGAMTTDGELWIGSTTGRHVKKGELTSPDGSITFGYDSPDITAEVNTAVITDLHVAHYIVSAGGLLNGANYTTVQDALNAANAAGGGTVFVQPGTYTENLTLYPNVNITSFVGEFRGQVLIVGKMSYSSPGSVELSNINFETNGDFILELTGSAASIVHFNECILTCSDNTGISYTVANASSQLSMNQCGADVSATGITLIVSTSTGNTDITLSTFTNSGNSVTASTWSSGVVGLSYGSCTLPISFTTVTGSTLRNFYFDTSNVNQTAFTMNAVGLSINCNQCHFISGTATALVITAGSLACRSIVINSSNAAAISGAGTIAYDFITFTGSSQINSVTTQNVYPVQPLNNYFRAYSAAGGSNVTGDGTFWTVVFDTEVVEASVNYDPATYTYTCPISGLYEFGTTMEIGTNTTTHTSAYVYLATTSVTYTIVKINPAPISPGGTMIVGGSIFVNMAKGDTAYISLQVTGGTKTAGIIAGNGVSSFWGRRVGG